MTIIAWDGKILAADKQVTTADLAMTTTKIWKHQGFLLAAAGGHGHCVAMRDWWINGQDPKAYPPGQADEDHWADLLVINPLGGICHFEQLPIPLPIEDSLYATGNGRDYALGAMAAGANAIRAVEIASRFSTQCGMGVDFLKLCDL